ncbi:YxlC family protein [Bacillus sp. FJAT-49711]|uniref:YxlC family protein n=1 Tax=Bacillus sp. FJAT-49711 TaxID=2833585 RepID=UPI001BC9A8E8|nr:YxlC family protein [Bacillus sp. FJAT-49711]MBS4218585.1 YxlC family protein [Bacillus sp. FJAT-49711]
MKKDNEGEWLNRFKKDMDVLDDVYEPKVPQQFQVLNTLNEFKARQKKAFKRELVTFLVTAFIILSSYIVFSLKMPPIFSWVQGLAFVFLPTILIAESRRKKKRNGVGGNGF